MIWLRNNLRYAEVQNLGVPAPGDEDVGGLNVAVDDTWECAASSPSATSFAIDSSFSVSSGRSPTICFSVYPSRYSMTM